MTDIAAPVSADSSATEISQTPAAATPNVQPTGTDSQTSTTPAVDAPPGWSKRADGQWAWKGIVDGEETELDHERASHFLRTKESAQKRYQEAARLREEAERREAELEAYLEEIKSPKGLRALAKDLGMSPREVAEEILAQELEEASLTPDQRRLRELEAQAAQWQRAQQEQAARQRQAAIQQAEQQARARLETGFTKSMDRVGVPQAPEAREWVQMRLARLYVEHTKNGIPAHIDDLTKRAVADYRKFAEPALAPDDLLERVWGDEALREKLRARYLEAAKPAHPSKQQPHPSQQQPRDETGKFAGGQGGRQVTTWDTANPRSFSEMLDKMSGGPR